MSSDSGGGLDPSSQAISAGTDLLKLGLNLLAQHTARVKGATNENQAANSIVPAFDQDVAEIAAAYRSGEASAEECIAACQAVDKQVYDYLKSHVGPPGTAWDGTGNCGKTCTVGCCLYYGDLHAGLYGAPVFAGGAVGMIPVLQGSGGQAGHVNQAYIPKVYSSKYGLNTRAEYWLDLTPPAAGTQLTGGIASVVARLTGQNSDPLSNLLNNNGGASQSSAAGGLGSGVLLVLAVPFMLIIFLLMGNRK